MQLDYTWEASNGGEFRLYGVASYQPESVRQLIADAPALDYSGNRDGPLEWQGNVGLDWYRGPVSVRWNTQFYDSYHVYDLLPVLRTSQK